MHIGLCPHCSNLHLYFTDENGEDFAEAVIGGALGRQLIRDLQHALYHQAVNGDGDAG